VLNVDPGTVELPLGQDPWAVLTPVPDVLEQDQVDVEIADLRLGHLVDAVAWPRPAPDPASALATLVADRQDELVTRMDQRIEIAAVDMPRQDTERRGTRSHAVISPVIAV
jgi:hypothetical protein